MPRLPQQHTLPRKEAGALPLQGAAVSIVPIYPNNGPIRPTNGTIRKPVLVLDASGEAAGAVIAALLAAGHPVIAASPEGAAPTLAAAGGPELVRLAGGTRTETAGAALANAVRLLRRPPGAVVAMFGGALQRGRLLDHPEHRLRELLDAELFPHVVAARHLLPLLAASGAPGHYIVVGGPAADTPWSGYGQASVASAALRMFSRALREETLQGSVRVQQLSVCAPLRTRAQGEHACPDWPEPAELGQQVVGLLATPGYEAVVRFDRRRPT